MYREGDDEEPAGDTSLFGSATNALLDHGELDLEWVLAFKQMVVAAPEAPVGTWAARYFRTLHLVSMYLPIRYRVWSSSVGRRRPETEKVLAEVSRVAEVALWTQGVDSWQAGGDEDDVAFARWVFDSVEDLCAGRSSLEAWDREYERRLAPVDARRDVSHAWPRWPCLAVHFASFYLDIGLTRERASIVRGGASAEEEELFRRVEQAAGAATRDIVVTFITNTDAPRDSSGSLLVGSPRKGARRTRVRGWSEVSFLRRRPFDGLERWL